MGPLIFSFFYGFAAPPSPELSPLDGTQAGISSLLRGDSPWVSLFPFSNVTPVRGMRCSPSAEVIQENKRNHVLSSGQVEMLIFARKGSFFPSGFLWGIALFLAVVVNCFKRIHAS